MAVTFRESFGLALIEDDIDGRFAPTVATIAPPLPASNGPSAKEATNAERVPDLAAAAEPPKPPVGEDATAGDDDRPAVVVARATAPREPVPAIGTPSTTPVESALVELLPGGAREQSVFGRPLPKPTVRPRRGGIAQQTVDVPRQTADAPVPPPTPAPPLVATKSQTPPPQPRIETAKVAAAAGEPTRSKIPRVSPTEVVAVVVPEIAVKTASARTATYSEPEKAKPANTGKASIDLASVVNRPVEAANDEAFKIGLDAYTAAAYQSALAAWQILADNGDPRALFGMGLLYHNGYGVTKDYAHAARLFRQAADQGYAEAQYNLSLLYTRGHGVRQDYGEAVAWVRRATDQGIAAEPAKLSLLYHVGKDLPQPNQGIGAMVRRLLSFASPKPAQYQKGLVAYHDGNYVGALALWRPLAERGLGQAQFALATAYALGHGVPLNDQKALDWLTQAADQGVGEAQYNLGVRFALGQGVAQDGQQAVVWYSRAAE